MVSADAPFLRACRREAHDRVPVWFMRQAGRSLPEYRAIRGEGSITQAIRTPDLATEITLQPVRRYGTDAAILYSDIVTPLEAIGFGVDVAPGIGPVVERPFTSAADLDRIRPLDPEANTPFVLETVRNLVRELGDVPLIGFAGAPFTVASYLVEGRPSRTYEKTKRDTSYTVNSGGLLPGSDGKSFARYQGKKDSVASASNPRLEGETYSLTRIVFSRAIRFDGRLLGWVVLEIDLTEMYAQLVLYAALISLLVPLALAMALHLQTRLLASVTTPLTELAQKADRVSAGEFDQRVFPVGIDELDTLGRSRHRSAHLPRPAMTRTCHAP